MNNKPRRKVIYLVGSSRSGSTILNILLGNFEGIFAAGELNHYMSTGKNSDEYCSCGESVSSCEFWNTVDEAANQTNNDKKGVRDLALTFENWRSLLPFNRDSTVKKQRNKYIERSDAYYNSVLNTSKEHFIVDASKSPIRLINLLNNSYHEYKIIHTVRDPRAICVSLKRSLNKDLENGVQKDLPGRPFRKTIKELYLISMLSIMTRFRVPKGDYLQIRHEDLIAETDATLSKLQKFTGIGCEQLTHHLLEGGELKQSHNVAGNRLQMRKEIKISPRDHDWHKELSNARALLLTILLLPLLLLYQYPLRKRNLPT